jgi:hypothetical protein
MISAMVCLSYYLEIAGAKEKAPAARQELSFPNIRDSSG